VPSSDTHHNTSLLDLRLQGVIIKRVPEISHKNEYIFFGIKNP
jgi:hypothetical protein